MVTVTLEPEQRSAVALEAPQGSISRFMEWDRMKIVDHPLSTHQACPERLNTLRSGHLRTLYPAMHHSVMQ